MIDATWAVIAFLGGAVFGLLIAVLMTASSKNDDWGDDDD